MRLLVSWKNQAKELIKMSCLVMSLTSLKAYQHERRKRMLSPDRQTLLEVAQWIATHRNRRSSIRQFAVTEENYLCLIQELDRVENQCSRARTVHAASTLTLVEWLETLEYFHWRCAYCQEKPFQVMSHYLDLDPFL